jgi:CubicO group peptidase (beta-lactamase class C family)
MFGAAPLDQGDHRSPSADTHFGNNLPVQASYHRFPLFTQRPEWWTGLFPARAVLARQPLWFTPGTAWEYGLNTDVLGYLIEVASGKPLDRYLREFVFDPLGMVDTTFHVPDAKRDRLAAVYQPVAGGGIRRMPDDPPVVKGNLQCSPSHV